jgi:fructose-1,6-bisphosphatase/inositol monophosphatase family enzyme
MNNLEKILLEAINLASKTMLEVKNNPDYFVDVKEGEEMSESNVLTLADIKTEEALKNYFSKVLPEYNFLGEESANHSLDTSKIIVTDPIDCTLGFTKGLSNFGSIIGIYSDGMCIAGAESNAKTKTTYTATYNSDFKRYGPKENLLENTIYIEAPNNFKDVFGKKEGQILNEMITEQFKKAFPDVNLIIHEPNVLNKARVFSKGYLGLFHGTWSRHDLAAAPIFARKTNSYLSDHNGNSFEPVDFENEFKKYNTKENVVVYSIPTIIASDKRVYEKMLNVLLPFKKELDFVSNPKY